MASLPYMVSTGLIGKILKKIEEARRPDRFTGDFLETKLGFSGGSAAAIIPLLKRLGFLASDGTPTELYDQFRNNHTQGHAMARALKNGFKEIYDVNEYAHDLSKDKLTAVITQITGAEKDSRATRATAGTFEALKQFANFDVEQYEGVMSEQVQIKNVPDNSVREHEKSIGNVDLKLSYTINLNLPETSNPEVFNAIFKSLKENLLKE